MREGNETLRSLADLACVYATETVNPTTWPRKAGLAGGKESCALRGAMLLVTEGP